MFLKTDSSENQHLQDTISLFNLQTLNLPLQNKSGCKDSLLFFFFEIKANIISIIGLVKIDFLYVIVRSS